MRFMIKIGMCANKQKPQEYEEFLQRASRDGLVASKLYLLREIKDNFYIGGP